MKVHILAILLLLPIASYSGERLKGISGSMKESTNPFSNWFSDEDEAVKDKKKQDTEKPAPLKEAPTASDNSPSEYYDEEAGCLMQKAYILDVENPEQYKRIEDYPYTYECAVRR